MEETLEEVREYAELSYYNGDEVNAFIAGAQWQQERSYSEEDLRDAFQSGFTNGFNINSVTFEEWFEQFKKK